MGFYVEYKVFNNTFITEKAKDKTIPQYHL